MGWQGGKKPVKRRLSNMITRGKSGPIIRQVGLAIEEAQLLVPKPKIIEQYHCLLNSATFSVLPLKLLMTEGLKV